MRLLWPPLTIIESNLLVPIEQQYLSHEVKMDADAIDAIVEDDIVIDIPPISTFLRELIQKRVNTQKANFSGVPTPGQILLVNQLVSKNGNQHVHFSRPFAVLINQVTQNQLVWIGWITAAETDYASYWDMLLEPEDEPYDPLVGMIQVWNQVQVYLPSAVPVLAELKTKRLQAVRALAEEYSSGVEPNPTQTLPGYIAPRPTLENFSVLTGTPLGGKDDPRYDYQVLYRKRSKQFQMKLA